MPAPFIASAIASSAASSSGSSGKSGKSGILANILNILPSILQFIEGGKQLKQARDLERQNTRPNAEIAPSVNKLVNYSYGQTLNQDIPGGELYRNEIKGATASGMRAASELGSGAEAYGMLGQIVGREQNAFGDLAKQTAQQVQNSRGDYMNALGEKANEENRIWDWNKAQPYLQAAQMAAQLRDSGTKNRFSGISGAFGSGAEWAAPDFNSSIIKGGGRKGDIGQMSSEDFLKSMQQYFSDK
jgi:hypothetical protein